MRDQRKEPAEYLVETGSLMKGESLCETLDATSGNRTRTGIPMHGRSWGWYEPPPGIEVGFWGSDKDDLKGGHCRFWNEVAERISRTPNADVTGPCGEKAQMNNTKRRRRKVQLT